MFDENSLVERVLSGDEDAFARLVARLEPRVYQYALRYLNLAQTKDRHGAFAAALALLNVRADIRRKAQRPDRQAQLHIAVQLAVHLIKRLNGCLPRLLFFSQIAQRILIDASARCCCCAI